MFSCRSGSKRSANSRWPIPIWTSSPPTPGSRSTGAGRAASTGVHGFPVDDQRAGHPVHVLRSFHRRVRREGPPGSRRLRRVAGPYGGLGLLDPASCSTARARRARGRGPVRVPDQGRGSLTADHPQSLRSFVVMLDKVAARHDLEAGEVALVRRAPRPVAPGGIARRGGGGTARAPAGRAAKRPPCREEAAAFGVATRLKATVAALAPALARPRARTADVGVPGESRAHPYRRAR